MKDDELKREVRRGRRWSVAVAVVLASIAASIAASIIRDDREYDSTAIRTADLIVDDKVTIGSGSAVFRQYTGDPNAHVGAVKGSLVLDTSSPGVWYNSTGSNVWVQLGSGGGGGSGFSVAGWGLIGSGSAVSLDSTGCGSNSGWVLKWNGSNAWTCAAESGSGGGGGVTGSLSVTVNTFPAGPVNLSTVGTTDWYWYGATSNPGVGGGGGGADWTSSSATVLHWKKGGELFRNFVWIGHGIGSAPGNFPGTTTFTSTASDDSYGVALSATDGTYDLTSTVGLGYQFNAAAGPTARTLRLYTGAKGVVTTITASFDDGSVTAASSTFSAASGVHELRAVDIAFQAAAGTRLRVTVLATTLNGGIEDEDFYGAAEF